MATVEAVGEQCVSTVKKSASDLGVQIQVDQEKLMRDQIKAITDEHNAIRTLVCEFFFRMRAGRESILFCNLYFSFSILQTSFHSLSQFRLADFNFRGGNVMFSF